MADSLVIADTIEVMGGGVASTIAECAGVIFRLAPGFDLSAPQPTSDYIASLVLDGEVPVGQRASNRTIVLPLVLYIPGGPGSTLVTEDANRTLLIAGREILARLINQQHWVLRWTREGSNLPTIFDCYRANATKAAFNTREERQGVLELTISFPAAPYGRSDNPVSVSFQSPLSGVAAPPPAVQLDGFASVSSPQWASSSQIPAGVSGSASAFWDPGLGPASDPQGLSTAAVYTGASITPPDSLCPGWSGVTQGSPATAGYFILAQAAAQSVKVGDQCELRAGNYLPANDSGFEGGIGGWGGALNCSVAQTAAQAHTGTHSLQLSSTAAGTMNAVDPTAITRCVAGDVLQVSAWVRTAVSARTAQAGVQFTDVNGTVISTLYLTGVTDSSSAWTQVTGNITAPAGTYQAYPAAQVQATGGAAEVHYFDDFSIISRGSPLVQTQIFTITGISTPFAGFVNVFISPNAAGIITGNQLMVQTGPPVLASVTLWAGLGSTAYYHNFARRGGPVHFLLTLTDIYNNTCTSSKIVPRMHGSNNSNNPKWTKVRIPILYKPGFDYGQVSSYTLTVTNHGSSLAWTNLYIASVTAVPRTAQVIAPQRGVVYDLQGMVGSARCAPSFQFQQPGTFVTYTKNFTTPGVSYWPAPFAVTAVTNVLVIGGGGTGGPGNNANSSGGGSGGSSGTSASVGVTAGAPYKVTVGKGGYWIPGGFGAGAVPTLSSFTGDSVTVSAPGGRNGDTTTTGAAANAAGTPSGFTGGAGGAGVASGTGGGGGGGGSGGTGANGNPGGAAAGGTGGAAAAAVAGGGPGGRGGTFGSGNGVKPVSGYGGASGGSPANASGYLYPGYDGLVQFQYQAPPTFKSLLVHRPGFFAPEEFNPLVPLQPGDPVDGTVTYIIPSLVPGIFPRFNGTYSVCIVSKAWNNPSASRNVNVNVTLWEQFAGNSYPQNVNWSFVPNNLPFSSPFVMLGNLTIPLNEIPPDNLSAFYSVTVTDTNTSDTFWDVIFLDTTGSTVILNSPNAYQNMWVDEPLATRDFGMILGSGNDRPDAVSLLSAAQAITGGPLDVDPYGNQSLLAYCIEGAPNMQMTYYPRWNFDRLQ